MEYDDITKHTAPSLNIKQRFYEVYIQPYLKKKPNSENLAYLLDQAWNAWRLNIGKEETKRTLFVEWMCVELMKQDEDNFITLISKLLSETHDVGVRAETAERNVYNAKISKNQERIFRDILEQYKVFFENDFKFWATIPYYYICKVYGVKSEGKTPESYISIGASEKFHTLKNIHTSLAQGNPQDLVFGFDNEIRNAGAGHESWEITDKGTALLHVIDPKSGEPKGAKEIELTERQLEDLIKQCRRTMWILRMGLTIFLNNNPDFVAKLKRNKDFKVKEIERCLEEFADNRWFSIKEFIINEGRTEIRLGLKYSPKILGEQGQVFFGKAERYDLVKIEEETEYRYQILDILKYLVASFFQKPPEIKLKIWDEKDILLADLRYEPTELQKLYLDAAEENIPKSQNGELPSLKCMIAYEIRVPFGQRAVFEKILKFRKK